MQRDAIIEQIDQQRERLQISQSQLARAAGMPQSLMNAYLQGKKRPSTSQACRLLNAMGAWRLAFTRPADER